MRACSSSCYGGFHLQIATHYLMLAADLCKRHRYLHHEASRDDVALPPPRDARARRARAAPRARRGIVDGVLLVMGLEDSSKHAIPGADGEGANGADGADAAGALSPRAAADPRAAETSSAVMRHLLSLLREQHLSPFDDRTPAALCRLLATPFREHCCIAPPRAPRRPRRGSPCPSTSFACSG